MKKQILMMLVALIPMWGMAQEERSDRKHMDKDPEEMTEKMTEELELTADQRERVLEINRQKKARMEQVKEEYRAQLKDVLNEEQIERWEEMKMRKYEKGKMHHKKDMRKESPQRDRRGMNE